MNFLQELASYIEARRSDLAQNIAEGGCADWASYKAKVAEYKTLGTALEMAVETHKKVTERD